MELTQRNIEVLKKEKVLLESVNMTLDRISRAYGDNDQISEALIELALAMRDEGFKNGLKEARRIVLNTK